MRLLEVEKKLQGLAYNIVQYNAVTFKAKQMHASSNDDNPAHMMERNIRQRIPNAKIISKTNDKRTNHSKFKFDPRMSNMGPASEMTGVIVFEVDE
jgi:hypothetical protein